MPIWFQTNGLAPRITPVEVERITERFVVLPNGRRAARGGTCESYFPTWEDAKVHLMTDAGNDVLAARRALEVANATLGNIKGLRPPKEG